jgi:nucleoside-diphosphate-sugar epimerase
LTRAPDIARKRSVKEAVMRAVVTGGAGFIGSHLIEALLARDDEVVCVERAGASRRWLAGLEVAYRDTGLDDVRALSAAFAGADVVFHLAGLTEARARRDFYAVNTEGTARVFRAAAAHNGRAPRVVLMSSLSALGPCRNGGGDRLSPDTVPYPISHYGHSKLLAEAIAHAFADRVPATIVRPTSVYGPRERGVLKLFRLVRRGVALTVGSWDRQVSLIHVGDVVQGLLAAADSPRAVNRTYCLAHPEPVTWRGFARAVGAALGREPLLVSVPASLAWGIAVAAEACARLRGAAAILNRERMRELVQHRWVCDVSRAVTDLGFHPCYGVDRGVAETAAWYRGAGWI